MIGAIIGDVIGSVYEWKNQKSTDIILFSRFTKFTDDSVMTVAIADGILNKQTFSNFKLIDYYKSRRLYADKLKEYARKFPGAIIAFLESNNFEDAIRKAISIGGDSDTIACIAGGIAQAYYKKIPPEIVTRVRLMLDQSLKKKIDLFNKTYNITFL